MKERRRMKPKVVMADGTAVTPITARERKRLNRLMKKRLEKRRKKYPEVRGKVVDYITYWFEEGILYVGIRFRDKSDFSLQFSSEITVNGIDLSDVKTGDYEVIREYYRRRDQ
ncbi:MAG TPA: hypothetical protein VGR72_03980 [Candidatus Acidoferrales bacterium]|nr:hypothetical protein [Candidatus Acidoferrales bacterium]